MILELFGILVLVGIVMIILGFYTEVSVYSTVGFFFLFLLSLPLINNHVEYKVGYNVTDVSASQTIINSNYQPFVENTRTYGIYLALASGAGMIIVLLSGTSWGRKIVGGIK